jgi:hypothetical protein
VVPVGFAYDPDERIVRIISAGSSQKVVNADRSGARAAVCQVDGVGRAERAYAGRYQEPRERSDRVAIVIDVDRVMGRA